MFTKDPETGMRNIGTYRMQVFDGRTTGMHWQRHKGGAQHHRVAERLGKRLEVAVALSPEPVLTYCATAPMPEGLDELLLGGFLSRRRIELVKCRTVALEVPASSHIVLEGYVDPGTPPRRAVRRSHRFVFATDDYPVLHLTVSPPQRPTYLTIVGVPPMEDYYLGLASERIFLPMIQKTVPEIVDMHFPAEGIFHNLVIISIDKRYPGHARKIMNAVWGLGQLMFSKTVVVVDKDVNVHDVREVAWIVGTHMDPMRDVQMTRAVDVWTMPPIADTAGRWESTRPEMAPRATRALAPRIKDRGGGPARAGHLDASAASIMEGKRAAPHMGRLLHPQVFMPTRTANNTFLQRLIGAMALDVAIYEEVESDRGATTQAFTVVILASIAAGIGARGFTENTVYNVAFIAIIALLAWSAWALVTFEVGGRLMPEPQTRVDVGQLLRTIGFASTPGMLLPWASCPRPRCRLCHHLR